MPAWTIAAAQYAVRSRSVAENISHHLRFIHAAAEQNCRVLLFPEMALTGPATSAPLPPPPDPELLQPLCYAADRYQMTIITGLSVASRGSMTRGVAVFVPGARQPHIWRQGQGTCLSPVNHQYSIFADDAEGNEIDPLASLFAIGTCTEEFQQQQSATHLQRFAHKYAIAVLKANATGGSALWDENGQLIVRADDGDLLLTGQRSDDGWEGDIIPMQEHVVDEYACGA